MFWEVGVGFTVQPMFEVGFGQKIEVCERREGPFRKVWYSLSLMVVDV